MGFVDKVWQEKVTQLIPDMTGALDAALKNPVYERNQHGFKTQARLNVFVSPAYGARPAPEAAEAAVRKILDIYPGTAPYTTAISDNGKSISVTFSGRDAEISAQLKEASYCVERQKEQLSAAGPTPS